MEFFAKNVRKREDINWVGSCYYVSRAYKRPQRLTNEIFEVCHDFLGKRYGFDNIVGRPHGRKQPHTCTQITQSFMTKENKYQGYSAAICSIERTVPQGFIRETERVRF